METRAKSIPANKQFREKAVQVGHDLRELGTVARSAAAETWAKTRERALELERKTEKRIQEHPIQSVMVAAGAGFLIGYLVGRRR